MDVQAFESITESTFLVLPPNEVRGSKPTGKSAMSPVDHFRLEGFHPLTDLQENWEATQIRHDLFCKEWDRITERIERVMMEMNTLALDAIHAFVQAAHAPASMAMPIRELPTGLIFAGINIPDHDLLFSQIASSLSLDDPRNSKAANGISINSRSSQESPNQATNHVVILQSKDCPNLKSTLKCLIEGFLGLGVTSTALKESSVRLLNYDMVVLEHWYHSICIDKGAQGERPNLVVIIQDFECFDQATLQDLISICHDYQDRVPFVFLIGMATSADALHQGLTKSVLGLLRTRKFQMQQSSDCLTAIVQDLFIRSPVGLKLGPQPLKQLIDQFIHHSFSIGGFVAKLKYAVMHHFYSNPLSIFCDPSFTKESNTNKVLSNGHFDHMRMLPSIQDWVESLVESEPQLAKRLLTDNAYFQRYIPKLLGNLRDYHQNLLAVFDLLWFIQGQFSLASLKKSKRALYFMVLDGSLLDAPYLSLLITLIKKKNSNDMLDFLEASMALFKQAGSYTTDSSPDKSTLRGQLSQLEELQSRLKELLDVVSDESATSGSDSGDGEAGGNTANCTLLQTTPTRKRKLFSLLANENDKASRQTTIAKKTRETIRLPANAEGTYTALVKDIVQFFNNIFNTFLVSPSTQPLYEVLYYSQTAILQKAFSPQPRASIQTGLGQPDHYMYCTCCRSTQSAPQGQSTAELLLPTQQDTCILYKLYVECGRMINMYDWFVAFGVILEKNQDVSVDQQQVQARFIVGVAELQFMGFIKPTSRKTDHVMRLTWGGV